MGFSRNFMQNNMLFCFWVDVRGPSRLGMKLYIRARSSSPGYQINGNLLPRQLRSSFFRVFISFSVAISSSAPAAGLQRLFNRDVIVGR
jgi:hypothetical protein